LRTDLRCRKFKAELPGSRVNDGQRHAIGFKAKLDRGYRHKLYVHLAGTDGEGRSSENFRGQPADTATDGIQCIAQRNGVAKGTDGNRLPCRHIAGGPDEFLRQINCANFAELQLIL